MEVRTYRAKPSMREPLLDLLRSRAFPLQRKLGMRILGPFPSQEDEVTFVWLRGFPDDASRDRLKAAFYEGVDWLESLEPRSCRCSTTSPPWSCRTQPISGRVGRPRPRRRQSEVSMVANFALTLRHGPGWDASLGIREQPAWTEHAAYMDGLVADGLILLGGPIGDGQQTLHVVEAHEEDQVRRRLTEDPWARDGLLEVAAIQPWMLWLDFRSGQGPPPTNHPR
jgi:uncharacterized protein YciI